jgi:hypothetical protein
MTDTAITITSPGITEPIRIGSSEIASFDLRLSGYTLTEMLDTSQPLGTPRHATLKVTYADGRKREWRFSREGYSAEAVSADPRTQTKELRLSAENVYELTG